MNTLDNIENVAKSIIDICNKDKPVQSDKDELIEYQKEIATLIDNLAECDSCDAISDSIATITLNGVTANLCQECGVKALKTGSIEKKDQQTEKKKDKKQAEDSGTQSSQVIKSRLSQIPRLPTKVIENLSNAFNNLQEIAETTVKELQEIEGLGKKSALKIKNELTNSKSQQSADSNSEEDDNSNGAEDNTKPEIDWNELYSEIQSETNLKKSEVKRIHKLIKGIALPMKTDNTIKYIKSEIEQSKLNLEQSDTEKAVTMLMVKKSR